MNNSGEIIAKIRVDAEAQANENIRQAEEKAKVIIAKAESDSLSAVKRIKDTEKSAVADAVRRSETVAGIDAKKIIINKRAEIIDRVYRESVQYIMSDKRYKKYILELIERYAEDGDTVILSADEKSVKKSDIDALAARKGITLICDKSGAFAGGAVLSSSHADKNLTIESTIDQIQDDMTVELNGVLFGSKHGSR